MRIFAWVLLTLAWLQNAGGSLVMVHGAMAQNAPASGTLPPPTGQPHHSTRDQPKKPASPVPAEPIHKPGGPAAGKVPVVPPHGPVHPHKPGAAGKAAPPSSAIPPAAVVPPAAETTVAQPDKVPDPEKPEGAPARLPRFASLRSDDVNMRAGPGTRYRIDWVYKRRELPVEIEREFDVWRWVRDADGVQGWVHQATLMGRRSFIVQKADATLRADANDAAAAVAVLKVGVIGRIRSCEAASDWCNVQAGSYRGFLRRHQFWGALPAEVISP